MQNDNPLKNYFRQAKHFTPLPSSGKWYPPGSIEWPASGEVAVYPMTARDEIMMKTPDALLSGEATVQLIESCIPAIKDAWQVPNIDLDVILIAIRVATYGADMEISPSCPKCGANNHYTADLKDAMANSLRQTWVDSMEVNGLRIHLRPLNYKQITVKQLRTFEEQKLIVELNKSELSFDQKNKIMNEALRKLSTMTLDLVLDSIETIELPDGQYVSNREQIHEFLTNTDKVVFNTIEKRIRNNKEKFNLAPLKATCENEACKHEWEYPLEFDYVNFFEQES